MARDTDHVWDQIFTDSLSDPVGTCPQGSVKNINNETFQEANRDRGNEIRKGNRRGLKDRKWKTSLFCLLVPDWTQCKEDRTAERHGSCISGKRRGRRERRKEEEKRGREGRTVRNLIVHTGQLRLI